MQKGERFLKAIIIYLGLIGLFEMILAASFLTFFDGNHAADSFTRIAVSLNLDQDNRIISSAIDKASQMGSSTVMALAVFVFIVGIMNSVEAVGLHYRFRWAEWLTVLAIGVFIPFELYEVLESISALKVMILVINIAIVYYLGKHKELFGKKARQHLAGI